MYKIIPIAFLLFGCIPNWQQEENIMAEKVAEGLIESEHPDMEVKLVPKNAAI